MADSSCTAKAAKLSTASPNEEQSGWATKKDWTRHQALIGQLYEKQPLKEVMYFMESQHGFKATFVAQTVFLALALADLL